MPFFEIWGKFSNEFRCSWDICLFIYCFGETFISILISLLGMRLFKWLQCFLILSFCIHLELHTFFLRLQINGIDFKISLYIFLILLIFTGMCSFSLIQLTLDFILLLVNLSTDLSILFIFLKNWLSIDSLYFFISILLTSALILTISSWLQFGIWTLSHFWLVFKVMKETIVATGEKRHECICLARDLACNNTNLSNKMCPLVQSWQGCLWG